MYTNLAERAEPESPEAPITSGTTIYHLRLRSIQSRDCQRIRAFLHRLSLATVKARYLGGPPLTGSAAEREVTRLLGRDRTHHTVLVAVAEEEIRGIAEYVEETPGRAELAIVVEDEYQSRGIGKRLFRALVRRARARGIQIFTGDVAAGNHRVLARLRRGGQGVRTHRSYGSVRFEILLATAS
jgi:GNAT superfamily N-acetyltransferase